MPRSSIAEQSRTASERSLLRDEARREHLETEIPWKYSKQFKRIGIFKMAFGMSGFITLFLYSLYAEKHSHFEGYVVYFGTISCVLFTIAGILASSISARPSKQKIMSGIILACGNLISEIALMVVLIYYIISYHPRQHENDHNKKGLLYLSITWIFYEVLRSALSAIQNFFSLDADKFITT